MQVTRSELRTAEQLSVLHLYCREEKSEELRKVHESKMLFLNKTQTDKVSISGYLKSYLPIVSYLYCMLIQPLEWTFQGSVAQIILVLVRPKGNKLFEFLFVI